MKAKDLSKPTLAAIEIDCRAHDLMFNFLDEENPSLDLIVAYLRAAYALGYKHCLAEEPEQRGKWFKDCGYSSL